MEVEGNIKQRLKPWQILVALLYMDNDYISWTADESISLDIGPLARFLRIPNYRLRDHLRWLYTHGYFRSLSLEYGKAEIEICIPTSFYRYREKHS